VRLRATLTALTLLPMAAFTVAAGEAPDCDVLEAGETSAEDILACTSTMYLDCDGAQGGKFYDGQTKSSVGLTAEAPATSFTAGGGCGGTDEPLFRGTEQGGPYSFDVAGYFDAVNPDTLTVELHDISASVMRDTGSTVLGVRLTIDGESVFGYEEIEAVDGTIVLSPATRDITVDAVTSSTGVSDALVFTVLGLRDVLPSNFYAAGAGDLHDVRLTVDFDLDGEHTMVWGATEVPANITFNGDNDGAIVLAN
jgi:hypothetical protein